MILHAVGGLANRLRAMLSYRVVYGSIGVVWDIDEYVSRAHFLDVFEPIDGIEFVTGKWQKEDFAPHPERPAGWEAAYRMLRPRPPVQQRIDELCAELGTYIAVHIRRTDHVPNMATLGLAVTPEEDYRRFVAHWPSHAVYVATDNGETQERWIATGAKVGARLGGTEAQGLVDHHRNGTLADAVVDMFVCARAHAFSGTAVSSFTDTIQILRGHR